MKTKESLELKEFGTSLIFILTAVLGYRERMIIWAMRLSGQEENSSIRERF